MIAQLPITCEPFALSKTERERSAALRVQLSRVLKKTAEEESGIGFSFPDDPAVLAMLVEWIPLERRCCPFLVMELSFPQRTAVSTLWIRGPAGTKAFLREELPELP